MTLSETLGMTTVADFLTAADRALLVSAMHEHIAELPVELTSHCARIRSVHTVPGLSRAEAMAIYEPAGRLEIDRPPAGVLKILEGAGRRSLHALKRVFPSVRRLGDWIYVEYGPGQYITPHIDCVDEPDSAERRQIAGISVVLDDHYEGGEFVIATTVADRLFQGAAPDRVAPGADSSSAWFRALPCTEWACRPGAGTAICYGSQLIHSTRPVTEGLARKFIGFLTS